MPKEAEITIDPNVKRQRVDEFGRLVGRIPGKDSVLVQNRWGRYTNTDEETAKDMEKRHLGVILRPSDPDWSKARAMSIGHQEGVTPGQVIQMNGQYVAVEDIGKFNREVFLKEGEEILSEYKDKEEKGTLKKEEQAVDMTTFAGKTRRRSVWAE